MLTVVRKINALAFECGVRRIKHMSAIEPQQFTVEVVGNYVHLKTWGKQDVNKLDEPANAALALAKEQHIDLLLDDIRGIDSTDVSILMQSKAMGILWKLRTFKKVAIVLQTGRLSTMFFSTLDAIHVGRDTKFKGFDTEPEAIAWLQETPPAS